MEDLFSRWQQAHSFSAFIKDGIVDTECYAKPHILFVLRDMNCKSERNLCEDLRKNGSGWKTWNNIGRWTKALLDGSADYPFDMSEKRRVEQLKRIAVMNLKKEGGGSRAIGDELLKAVKEQRDLIYEEICLCDPDIIICCGLGVKDAESNAALLRKKVLSSCTEWEKFSSQKLNREWWYYYSDVNGKQVPVVSFCHPQVTNLNGKRGHNDLFIPLYEDMLFIKSKFLNDKEI